MAIHFNIGEAKGALEELIAAAKAGEEVVICRAGKPIVRMEPIEEAEAKEFISRRA